MRLGPGTLLQGGEYTVVRSISKGGMGAVYLARDRRAFGRLCVVKQMLDYYDPNDAVERRRAQERFEEEGRTLASLSHPGIPRIYAFFQEGGGYYIVMEHIQGENLESFCTRQTENGVVKPTRRLHLEETLRYGMQAAFILEYLHGQSRPVVHQDIKPANLILEGQMGDVRLVDFGTARVRMPEGASPGNGDKASIYGTDGYAPPEQYRGHPVPQSDVFSLAATLYHLLTDDDPRGHPFQWPKLAMLPKELSAAMERALRHDPYKRPSARELRQALEAFVAPHRTLEVFTFPGNHQIRIVAALPVLCDEHWDAARSFLYEGDFKRWLRDINRHDLVVTADGIVQRETNRDRGLEAFLHAVDAGLAAPRLTVDQAVVDLGPVAREAALIRRVTVSNSTRGYTLATVQVSDSWVEVYPQQLHLWAGIPSDIRIQVRADSLPLRSRQLSVVRITADGQDPVEVQVTARVSLTREVARLAWRALSAAVPESWRLLKRAWAFDARLTGTVVRPLAREPRLFWALWFLLGMGAGAALYLPLAWGGGIPLVGRHLAESAPWDIVVVAALLGPLAFSVGLWLAWMALSLLGSALWGAARGAWKSFVR
jgi:serine/threonine protein kinase